jgi:RHS repeat-associated protein
MLSFNDKNIVYDNNGNMTSITNSCGTTNYTWDVRNRLVAINGFNTNCSSLTASFKYDALNRRIEKTINGATTKYLYDGLDIIQELNQDSTVKANYIRGLNIDEPLARIKADGTIRYYQQDALGSVIALTDDTGAVKTTYTYDPFGNVTISGEASDNPFQYTGRENDGTGLLYYRARYYSPELQRFISEDPIGLLGGINKFAYVYNSPTNWIDPHGLDVTITIDRTTYTPNSIIGTISVNSTVTNSTFSGYTMENRNPPNPDLPVPPGTYAASMRTDHTPNRVELIDVPNASNIQIHVGNSPSDVVGCFAVGTSTSTDWVGGSTNAMNRINNIIAADGSGNITVIIGGSTGGP